jgi:hypothetical protein
MSEIELIIVNVTYTMVQLVFIHIYENRPVLALIEDIMADII